MDSTMVRVVVNGIVDDLAAGLPKEKVEKFWLKMLDERAQLMNESKTKTEMPTVEPKKPETSVPMPEKTAKRGTPSSDTESVYVKLVNEMTPLQLTEELFKLTEKFSYHSLGKALNLTKNSAYSTLRSWCTGGYLPSGGHLKKIRQFLIGAHNKNSITLKMLTPAGKRPKGGFAGTIS